MWWPAAQKKESAIMIKAIAILLIINLVLWVVLLRKNQKSRYGEIDVYKVLRRKGDRIGEE